MKEEEEKDCKKTVAFTSVRTSLPSTAISDLHPKYRDFARSNTLITWV